MSNLYTAFKGFHNTSFQLVSQLCGDKLFLTNSFQGLEKEILSLGTDYDAIYMFGIDKNLRNGIRIETCANYNGESVNTSFDIITLEKAIKNLGVSYIISNKPTEYLCNAAYYHMLKKNRNTVFIHIPSMKGMNPSLMNKLLQMV
jgi:hypothetical protein